MKNTAILAILSMAMLGCGSPSKPSNVPPPQGWTVPGTWTLSMTVTSVAYGAGQSGE